MVYNIYPFFLSDFNHAELSRQIFEKYSNINFHEHPSSRSPVCSTRTDRQADMMKLRVAFRNSTNGSKNAAKVLSRKLFHRILLYRTQRGTLAVPVNPLAYKTQNLSQELNFRKDNTTVTLQICI